MTNGPCEVCELEQILRLRSNQIRQRLQVMNPVTDPDYDRIFGGLVYAEGSLKILTGSSDGITPRSHAGGG